jgi:hypothetical protein
MFPRRAKALMTAAVAVLAAAALPGIAQAADCTSSLSYDPNVPTWDQFFSDPANAGSGAIQPFASGAPGRSTGKNTTANLDKYFDGVTTAVNTSPGTRDRVEIVKKSLGASELGTYDGVPGRDLAFWVIGTKANIDKLDGPGGDAEFWAGVRSGSVSKADGLAGIPTHPAFGWVTATPHGNEPAAGEAISRELYELAARLDCENLNRLQSMDTFLMPVRNPDGRDNNVRTTAWAFDPNRDFGTHNQIENDSFIPEMNKYPGVFFIDAHQQTTGYFFPPNEDPVLSEISQFSLNLIQDKIGPTLQGVFNDQSSQYQNYNSYDLFTPEYGDTVPSLLMGAAGMTYEKGTDESYSKQVYDHYLAIDTTINLTAQDKSSILSGWVSQWQEAVGQGENCQLQQNQLVSPLHDTITQLVPQGGENAVCGYFYKPGQHTGDVAALLQNLTEVGVHVSKLSSDATLTGVREFGRHAATETLPAGTLYITMAQPMKHWIQAVLAEDPFIPYNYYYDVVDWSYSTQRGLAGDGWLTQPLPANVAATLMPVTSIDLGSAPTGAPDVYAFNTDSMQGLALSAELLDKGVAVYRGETAFDENGHHFATGATLVDGASLRATAGVDLSAMAAARETDVYGLGRYPVAHKALVQPRIGLYTGATTIPTNPINMSGANVNGTTGQCTATSFCEAYFTLVRKDRLPASMVQPVTTTDLQGGVLTSGGFTALINPTTTIAAADTASLGAISTFVNAGGIYVGDLTGGLNTARNAGLTTLNTSSVSGLNTPGTTFDATFDTTNPVAWGFDAGGWLYRDGSSNPTYDPATLPVGATAAVSYAGSATTPGGLRAYGYQVNALNTDSATGRLDGRPAVVDQPLGSGHAILLGFDPFFRAWKEQDERIVLNAVMYPLGASQPATSLTAKARAPTAAAVAEQAAPVEDPLKQAELPKVASRPAATAPDIDRDVRITIRTRDLKALRKAVAVAKLPASARRKVVFVHRGSTLVFVVKGVRPTGTDHHPLWIGRVMHQLTRQRVHPLAAQL